MEDVLISFDDFLQQGTNKEASELFMKENFKEREKLNCYGFRIHRIFFTLFLSLLQLYNLESDSGLL